MNLKPQTLNPKPSTLNLVSVTAEGVLYPAPRTRMTTCVPASPFNIGTTYSGFRV
jgi:hypothetical protein